MVKKSLFVLLCLFTCTIMSAQQLKDGTSIQYLGTEMDGSLTLRVTGYGRNSIDSRDQCKKNAVNAVLFTGIRSSSHGGAALVPLVTEVNGREKHDVYFNNFFADHGEYLNYVSLKDKKAFSTIKSSDRVGFTSEMTVRVLRSKLKEKLIQDNIIPADHQ